MTVERSSQTSLLPPRDPRAHLHSAQQALERAYQRARARGYHPECPEMAALLLAETHYQQAKTGRCAAAHGYPSTS